MVLGARGPRGSRDPADPRPADWAGREDLRERTIITIDGESARDFDDAVSIERLENGYFRLGVHIADVEVDPENVAAVTLYRRFGLAPGTDARLSLKALLPNQSA